MILPLLEGCGRQDMRSKLCITVICGLTAAIGTITFAQGRGGGGAQQAAPEDPVKTLVGRLELEKYKATIKGLTQFGDRRQGTERNRKAVDWIEAQLKSYGCSNIERVIYMYPAAPATPVAPAATGARGD